MNVVPPSNFQSQVSTDKGLSSNAIKSLPDTLRQQNGGSVPQSSQLSNRHPLEARLQNWEETQRKRQLEQYRQIFGIAEPMKRVMDLKLVEQTDFNPLNQSNLHRDILLNKDSSIDWEDVYGEPLVSQSGNLLGDDVHAKIESHTGI
ncbi:hypothetical protein ZYGR_0U02780 [Zygosaccharomyces rouxii]|uniref:ZYRO0F14982p n=2 Tax=Zygosaccharomyces rouxii TaxID=4956 RepID=C5DYQ8_ZYGRC|nr:uncharacterized protein ZYRO0F14982g [Zygosaccharomyces rouxii]KAH9199675.1 proteasome maturation factor UMP1 [Zygosaccharomyces rouxii]GAV50422.1 hypothetical protein ZYGR_0U02780 [Zygosaccharomyces rouxii]CAR28919.1 ZYRO0F14982p [Zygosaccharomyces rouxii]